MGLIKGLVLTIFEVGMEVFGFIKGLVLDFFMLGLEVFGAH